VIIGQTNTRSFQFTNLGDLTLTGTVVTTLPFAIQRGSSFSLTNGETAQVLVGFAPDSAANFSNVVVFTSNGGNSTNPVVGSGLTPAQMAVSPPGLDFGTVAVGSTVQANFVVTNLGGASLSNGTASLSLGPPGFTILSGTPFNLPGFGSTNVVVRFSPTNEASFSNVVLFAIGNNGNSTNPVTGVAAVMPTAFFTGGPTSGVAPLQVIL